MSTEINLCTFYFVLLLCTLTADKYYAFNIYLFFNFCSGVIFLESEKTA